jgi:hypothetical protein
VSSSLHAAGEGKGQIIGNKIHGNTYANVEIKVTIPLVTFKQP